MAQVLLLKSSILGGFSQSSVLLDYASALLQENNVSITMRDLSQSALPSLDGDIASGLRGGENLSAKQLNALAVSDELIAEIKAHDTLVIAAPMYNFSIPVPLKSWIDLIARAGVTFSYTPNGPVGLLEGKRVVIVTTTGGLHQDSPSDHVVPYLKTIMGFIGIKNVDVVYAGGLNMGEEIAVAQMAQAKQALSQLIL